MNVFTDAEQSYVDSQPLGRLATLGPGGDPQTRPVGYTYNRDLNTIDIGGHNLAASRKYRSFAVPYARDVAVPEQPGGQDDTTR